MQWESILQVLSELGYASHDTSTSGIHIHVECDALGRDTEEQEQTISKILFFVERNWTQLLLFSRRTEEQMRRWSNRYGNKNTPEELIQHVKSSCVGRYTCVNLQNDKTIEFRMFRGTLKYGSFIAILQLIDEICNMAISMSTSEVKQLDWNQFVNGINQNEKSELVEYLISKQLYTNEWEVWV